MPPLISWRLVPGQHLLHRCWDGECVLYNDLTGDTHLVDAFTLELLELLGAAPRPAGALAAALGALEEHPDVDAALDDPLAELLADLAALHLIEAAC
ncbi:HPr-rel-A system PqqD family peptide chaperone [Massilia sp. SYSU DXS3249]